MNREIDKKIKIALVGNPNSGKTTLFNSLTGSRQHVGNWSGVTVEKKEGVFSYGDYTFEITDLPGIYSLEPNSIEEIVARNFIIDEKPDVILNIVDGTTFERSLYLTTQIAELNTKIVMAINMYDEMQKKGIEINSEKLEEITSIKSTPIVAKREEGLDELIEFIVNTYENKELKEKLAVNYEEDVEKAIRTIQNSVGKDADIFSYYNKRWVAISLLIKDKEILKKIEGFSGKDKLMALVDKKSKKLEEMYQEKIDSIIMERRFGFILGIVRESTKIKKVDFTKLDLTEKIDNIILNRFLGLPIFAFILWLTFKLTFEIGGLFQEYIEDGVGFVGNVADSVLIDGILKDLLIDGIIGGVGGVVVFLPQIVLLFLIIAILEDTGYMARVAFIMDRAMHFLGVHGKSFISLFMGFGCNVPGIMAARTLENEEDRIITVLVNPFMSCSARLPVYILIAGMFFQERAADVIFSIYIIGIVVAVITAKLLKTFFFKKESVPFVMELPPYRTPTLKSLMIHMWERASIFLKKMGGVILVGSIIIWALGAFPQKEVYSEDVIELEQKIAVEGENGNEVEELKSELRVLKRFEQMEDSYIGKTGKAIEPFFEPIGFTWREGVSLVTGIVAKEIFVSTISVLYGVGEEDSDVLKSRMEANGITPSAAYGLMLFVLLYTPCVATIAAIKRETNSLKWTAVSLVYGVAIGYMFSFVAYRIG